MSPAMLTQTDGQDCRTDHPSAASQGGRGGPGCSELWDEMGACCAVIVSQRATSLDVLPTLCPTPPSGAVLVTKVNEWPLPRCSHPTLLNTKSALTHSGFHWGWGEMGKLGSPHFGGEGEVEGQNLLAWKWKAAM